MTNQSNAITLTFNGVNFSLVPTKSIDSVHGECSSSITVIPQNNNGDVGTLFNMIQLKSFTGTLLVSEAPEMNCDMLNSVDNATPIVPSQPQPSPTTTMCIEDEGDEITPEKKSITSHVKGQQQLPFERKKRVRLDRDGSIIGGDKRMKNTESRPKKSATMDKIFKVKESNVTFQTQNVSPLLGQSSQSMLSEESSGEESDYEILTSLERSDETIQLARKPSIQELVHDAGDLTQKQHTTACEDVYEEEQPNTIIELHEDDHNNSCTRDSLVANPSQTIRSRDDDNIPGPRWGNTMTLIENSKVLVYGGQGYDKDTNQLATFNDLYVYDLTKRTWKKPINCEGMPRTWHSSTFLPDRSLLISFGGESYNIKTKKTQTTDQVMVLDTEIMLWYPPSVSGVIPSGRSGHSASLLDTTNELVVFGGVKSNKWQRSVAVLDTMRWKWSAPKVAGDAPQARSYHSTTPVPSPNNEGQMLVIFGGNNDVKSFNSVHVLDPTGEDGQWTWYHPNVAGDAPSPRTGHCATLLEDNKTILIYGGWDPCDDDENMSDEKMICGDSFLLDTEAWNWKPGPNPQYIKNVCGENGGKRRTGASSLLAPGDDLSQVLVFGGRVPDDKFANDFQTMTVPQRMIDVKLNRHTSH